MPKYNRITRLRIGPPGQEGIEITEHKTDFRILKDDEPKPNRATFTIYNLTDEENAIIEREDNVLVFHAGHEEDEDEPGVMFVGAPFKVEVDRSGPDRKTVIKSGDGKDFQKNTVSANIEGKATLSSALFYVLEGAVKDPEAAYQAIKGDEGKRELFAGLAYSAPARTVMVRLAAANRFDWIIEGDQVVILSPGEALRLPAVVVSRETGLIGWPKAVLFKGRKRGIKFELLLDARVRPRRLVEVRGEGDLDGFYQVKKMNASGDNGFGGAFKIVVEAIKVEPKPPSSSARDVPGMELLPAFQTIAEAGAVAAKNGVQGVVHVFERRLDRKLVSVDEVTSEALQAAGYAIKQIFD